MSFPKTFLQCFSLGANWFASAVGCVLVVITLLTGCAGGGSEGTGGGLKRAVFGTLHKFDSTPIAGAKVSVLETGDAGVTDTAGNFLINADIPGNSLTLEVSTSDLTRDITVSDLSADATNVSLELVLDPAKNLLLGQRIYMWARIGPGCDQYFDNKEIIRQTKKTPPELQCSVRFFVNGGTTPLSDIPGAVEVRACDSKQWRFLVRGTTGSGSTVGVGEIPFTFIDNERNCEYRIVAPYQYASLKELEVLIQTRTLQRKKKV